MITLFYTILLSASLQAGLINTNSKGVALDGYDPVSYFQGTPKKGSPNFSINHQGATFWFHSEKNLETFKLDEKSYLPQYGGWCAYAMGKSGEIVEVDPETFKITDGKLYLFYHTWAQNTLKPWEANEVQLRKKADENWRRNYLND